MSWSPSVYIGEMRPWPDSVHVVRGKTDEVRRYFPERTCRKTVGKHGHRWACSECDETLLSRFPSVKYPDGIVHYCPNCGAKVVDE